MFCLLLHNTYINVQTKKEVKLKHVLNTTNNRKKVFINALAYFQTKTVEKERS
jgi:hypothetical protein